MGVHGVAGSGKSTLIKELKAAADAGWTFIGLAPTSSATAKLGQDAAIDSRTVAALLGGGGHDITDRHVLVVDEAGQLGSRQAQRIRSEEHTSELQSLMRISYAVFCLTNK